MYSIVIPAEYNADLEIIEALREIERQSSETEVLLNLIALLEEAEDAENN